MHPTKPLQKRLGHRFRSTALLEAALIHPSHRYEGNEADAVDNQRLEFLGDAVLGLLAAESLYAHPAALPEGDMTQRRSRITNRTHLAEVGRRWELGDYLRMGKGEAGSGGADRESNLADAVEAVIGAVFLDGGMRACRKLFKHHLTADLEALQNQPVHALRHANPKGALQEWTQKQNGEAPAYALVSESGPAHDRVYRAVVSWKGRDLGTGSAPSKRAAEAEAARNALNAVADLPRGE